MTEKKYNLVYGEITLNDSNCIINIINPVEVIHKGKWIHINHPEIKRKRINETQLNNIFTKNVITEDTIEFNMSIFAMISHDINARLKQYLFTELQNRFTEFFEVVMKTKNNFKY